ncbi:hypothetical protein J437_LFUL004030 [Ladona fulva]|uniref:Uncharacterized protein n=1 Tax=Ladona fulva TaxID=123851 RepID=A0A8K0NZ28_LADFU|nr:hypothetical protein J437_LFUL004030 [Ladona fulva]
MTVLMTLKLASDSVIRFKHALVLPTFVVEKLKIIRRGQSFPSLHHISTRKKCFRMAKKCKQRPRSRNFENSSYVDEPAFKIQFRGKNNINCTAGFVKDTVYVSPSPTDVQELKKRITTALKTVTRDMIHNIWDELSYRADA